MGEKRQSAHDISTQKMIEAMPDGVLVIGADGRIVLVNRRAERLFGYRPKKLLGERIGCLIPEESGEKHKRECIDYFSDPKTMPMGGPHNQISGRQQNGGLFNADVSLSPLKTPRGAFVVAVVRDTSEQRRYEGELQLKSSLLEAVTDGVFVVDLNGNIIYTNEAGCAARGYTRAELLGMPLSRLDPPEYAKLIKERMASLVETGEAVFESAHYRKDRSIMPVEIHARLFDYDGRKAAVSVIRDITERKLAEESLKAAESKFRSLVEQSIVGIYIIQNGQFLYVNPKLSALFGYTQAEMVGGKTVDDLIVEPDRAVVAENIRRRVEGEVQSVHYEFRGLRKDGSLINVEVHGSVIEIDGKPAVIGVLIDITERKRSESKIKRMAFHDALTGLPNRRLLKEHLGRDLAAAKRDRKTLALLAFDLDQFKRVNDAFGHSVGDSLLKSAARRLKSAVRRADTAARVGGDEFTVILPGLSKPNDAVVVAKKIAAEFSKPFGIAGRHIFVSASIGISLFPDDGANAATLLRHADAGLHRAKDEGKGGYCFFMSRMRLEAEDRMALENDLRAALDRGELTLYYQPCVSISTGELIGAEALLRWRHPERGLVMPADFIPLAEETGLIVPIGEWVLKTACAQSQAWRRAGLGAVRMMVNLSTRQFREGNLPEVVASALTETGCEPEQLVLEITETLLAKDLSDATLALYELRDMGIKILLDDFGIGYSSLSSLKLFPIDTLKIDKLFIDGCATNADDAAIVNAVMSMAQSLRLNVIAEGVETPEQLAFIRAQNCQAMQGYLFSRPVPAADFAQLLRADRRLPGAA